MVRKKLGAIELQNIISAFTGAKEGEPAIIVQHTVDNQTLFLMGAITITSITAYFVIKKLSN